MNLSKFAINKILAKYKLFMKSRRAKNLKTRRRANKAIKNDQIEQIKNYIESKDNTPINISMIKNAVLPQDLGINPSCNSTISKLLKKKLKMLFKILHKWDSRRRYLQNQRLFVESLYKQIQLKKLILRKSLLASSTLVTWVKHIKDRAIKGKHSGILENSKNLSFSELHFYGILIMKTLMIVLLFGNFCIIWLRQEKSYLNRDKERYYIICDNAYIHKSKPISEFLIVNYVSVITISPYFQALNSTEKLILSSKRLVKKLILEGKSIKLAIIILYGFYFEIN